MPSTSWRAFRDLGSTTWGWEPFAFFRTNDDYWIALLVLLSRVPQFEHVLLLRLPDRAALARARPQYLQDAYQHFFPKKELPWVRSTQCFDYFHALRESVTRYFACCRLYHVFRFYSSNGVAKVPEIFQRSWKNHQSRNCTNAWRYRFWTMKVHYLITITDPFDHFARWKTKLFYRTELHSNHSSLLPYFGSLHWGLHILNDMGSQGPSGRKSGRLRSKNMCNLWHYNTWNFFRYHGYPNISCFCNELQTYDVHIRTT